MASVTHALLLTACFMSSSVVFFKVIGVFMLLVTNFECFVQPIGIAG